MNAALHRALVTMANVAAFAVLACVVAYWGWRWFGPSTYVASTPAIDDPVRALALSPPFGPASSAATAPPAPALQVEGEGRLLGVFAEDDGRGHALFRMPDNSARLVAAGSALTRDATLVAVRPDGVTLRDARGERFVALRGAGDASRMPAARGATARAGCAIPSGYKGPVVRLNAELVQGLMAQPESLRAIADVQDGGLVVRDEAGFAALLGMKKGDRVTQANGIALRAPEDVIVAVLRPLAASQTVRLTGSRGSEPRELVIVNASACPP